MHYMRKIVLFPMYNNIVYALELKANNVYVSETGGEATAIDVCAIVTGRHDSGSEDVIVILNFIDSQLAGIYILVFRDNMYAMYTLSSI